MMMELLKKHKYTIVLTLIGLPTLFLDLYYWLVLGIPPEYEITFFIATIIFSLGLFVGMIAGGIMGSLLVIKRLKAVEAVKK
jgi:hypothetical protein